MIDETLAAFLAHTFVPFIPFIGGFVAIVTFITLFIVMFSWLISEE